jgi:hypothetical protein
MKTQRIRIGKTKDRLARLILGMAALGALFAFVTAIAITLQASPEMQIVESWRMYGFMVFAGLFVLLAARPRHYPGVWELVMFHKASLTITAATFLSDAAGASIAVVVDGILTIMIITAYFLAKGYTAWERFHKEDGTSISMRLHPGSRG